MGTTPMTTDQTATPAPAEDHPKRVPDTPARPFLDPGEHEALYAAGFALGAPLVHDQIQLGQPYALRDENKRWLMIQNGLNGGTAVSILTGTLVNGGDILGGSGVDAPYYYVGEGGVGHRRGLVPGFSRRRFCTLAGLSASEEISHGDGETGRRKMLPGRVHPGWPQGCSTLIRFPCMPRCDRC